MHEKLLRAEEVAERLAISKAFAYQLMRTGSLPVLRLGRSIRVREQDLEQFISRSVHRENHTFIASHDDFPNPPSGQPNLLVKGENHVSQKKSK